jgi:hypothetical protein
MERSHGRVPIAVCLAAFAFVAATLLATGGCAPLLATGLYVWEGGNVVPPECEALKDQRVVVVCRPPSSHEYRQAGASRNIAQRVSELLVDNLKGADIVNPREVDNWVDETDWGDFKELAHAVHADKVVYVELNNYELYKGKTLYQGQADVTVSVYDMKQKGKLVWDRHIGEVLFPNNSGIPAQDKPVQQFEHEFDDVLATRIAQYFYKHDANADFALDAAANQ